MKNYLETIKEKWQMVITVTLMVTALVFIVSAIIPARYQSDLSVLVIQKQASSKVDAFSAAKSAEFLSDILAKVIETDAFLEDVKAAPFGVTDFSSDPEERRKQWDKTVDVKTVNNTGIIEISVFNRSRQEAEKIAQAVSWALSVRGHKYHGGGTRVVIRSLEGPITSIRPAVPNIWINTLVGFIVGLVGSVGLIYFFQDLNFKLFSTRRVDYRFDIKEKLKEQLDWEAQREQELIRAREEEAVEAVEAVEEPTPSVEPKAAAPENLPTSDEQKPSAQARALGFAPTGNESGPSEEEVKDRLNRLLKGDI